MTDLPEHPDSAATGAVLALLLLAQQSFKTITSITLIAPNQIEITLSFLQSPYRLTVERITEETQ